MTISDIHYGSTNKLAEDQDTGDALLSMAIEKFTFLSKQVDFILFLGDMPAHGIFLRSKKEEYEKVVFHALSKADSSLKPMFYITGNNDALTGNYDAFETEGTNPLSLAKDWTGPCIHCEGLMIDDSQLQHGGYYSSYVLPHNKEIVLIALNTIQWGRKSAFSFRYPNQDQDALTQLAWLEHQLQKNHAQQLLIAMHIPPGNNYTGQAMWDELYLEKFKKLLEQYHSAYKQITLLVSHTHMDEIRKIELKDKLAIYAYATPSISRNHSNNSGMKIFSLNSNKKMENYTTYYTSTLDHWKGEFYQAIGAKNAIFPHCLGKDLATCLNQLTEEQVCNYLEGGLYFGVKSDRVYKQVCSKTYRIH